MWKLRPNYIRTSLEIASYITLFVAFTADRNAVFKLSLAEFLVSSILLSTTP
jgi:hypothetical protein